MVNSSNQDSQKSLYYDTSSSEVTHQASTAPSSAINKRKIVIRQESGEAKQYSNQIDSELLKS
jgi:hypothetical protein